MYGSPVLPKLNLISFVPAVMLLFIKIAILSVTAMMTNISVRLCTRLIIMICIMIPRYTEDNISRKYFRTEEIKYKLPVINIVPFFLIVRSIAFL